MIMSRCLGSGFDSKADFVPSQTVASDELLLAQNAANFVTVTTVFFVSFQKLIAMILLFNPLYS